MRKAFITGVTGQDGAYLARRLLQEGYDVHGGVRYLPPDAPTNLETLGIASDVRLHRFDLNDLTGIRAVLKEIAADEVYNLAAQSSVAASWDDPISAGRANGLSVTAILEGLRGTGARFCQASTADMFGDVSGPCNEATPVRPLSPYGAAKAHAHHMVNGYRRAYDMHCSSAILFNHESPLRPTTFVTRKISHGLASIARGATEVLTLGNVEAKRDWGFAGDYADGMRLTLRQEGPDDYVFANGTATSIREFADLVAEALDLPLEWDGTGIRTRALDRRTGRTIVQVSERFYRPVEAAVLVGDATFAHAKLGWRPSLTVADVATMMARADYDALDPG